MARSKIEKASTDLNEAIKELDVDRICQHCANDAKLMPPGSQLLEGTNGVREFYTEWFKSTLHSQKNAVLHVNRQGITEAGSDHAIEYGSYYVNFADGTKADEGGNFVRVWKNDGGAWKVQILIWNHHKK